MGRAVWDVEGMPEGFTGVCGRAWGVQMPAMGCPLRHAEGFASSPHPQDLVHQLGVSRPVAGGLV